MLELFKWHSCVSQYTVWSMCCEGNKSDLASLRQVPFEEVSGFAERNEVFCAMETSAKDNVNIEETFVELARVTMHCFCFQCSSARFRSFSLICYSQTSARSVSSTLPYFFTENSCSFGAVFAILTACLLLNSYYSACRLNGYFGG